MSDQRIIFSPEHNQWTLADGRHHMEVPEWAREIMRDEFERETRPLHDSLDLALDSKRIAERRVTELLDENAKLRELVLDLYCLAYPSTVEWEVSDETYDKYSPCEKCQELHGGKSPCASTAKDMTEECCAPIQANVVADCLRELGVEVD